MAAAAAEGSFVVRAMQTLLAAEIREFSGSWADSAFVGLTLIYDHRERQMFRRSEDERGKRQVYIVSFCLCTSYFILCLCTSCFIMSLQEFLHIVSSKITHCIYCSCCVCCKDCTTSYWLRQRLLKCQRKQSERTLCAISDSTTTSTCQ